MKALVVYSDASGNRDFSSKIFTIQKKLRDSFETLDFKKTISEKEATSVYAEACRQYGAIIVCGGDGTFNHAVNVVMDQPKVPVLGYLNFGTLGDVGRNFGVGRGLPAALSVIAAQHREKIDIGKLTAGPSQMYFVYCAAFGAYSDIAYQVTRSKKKAIGRLAYYSKALPKAFRMESHSYHYSSAHLEKNGTTPFIMVLNGRNIGGFTVNRKGNITDGKMEVFLTKKGAFNGLLHYLPLPTGADDVCEECRFSNLENLPWCLDGEEGPSGDVSLKICHSALSVFSVKLS